jgi:hypothetical protein
MENMESIEISDIFETTRYSLHVYVTVQIGIQ